MVSRIQTVDAAQIHLIDESLDVPKTLQNMLCVYVESSTTSRILFGRIAMESSPDFWIAQNLRACTELKLLRKYSRLSDSSESEV